MNFPIDVCDVFFFRASKTTIVFDISLQHEKHQKRKMIKNHDSKWGPGWHLFKRTRNILYLLLKLVADEIGLAIASEFCLGRTKAKKKKLKKKRGKSAGILSLGRFGHAMSPDFFGGGFKLKVDANLW